MPIIEIGIFDHLVFLILAILFPLHGRYRFQALKKSVEAGTEYARINAYRVILAEEWLMTAVVAIAWLVLNRGAESLGLIAQTTLPALIGYGVTVLFIALLLLQARSIGRDEEKRRQVREAFGDLIALMPRNSKEKALFGPVAITAGICEEFLYRGFLLSYLAAWLPTSAPWLVVVLGGVLFGLAHLYQGPAGILKTGGIGILMGGLYWLTGSIWASVVLHAFIDLNSGWIGWRALQDNGDSDAPVAAAA